MAASDSALAFNRHDQFTAPERIASRIEFDSPESPCVSVVVVTYQPSPEDVRVVLDRLDAQTEDDFELVVVDNGTDWDIVTELAGSEHARLYVELERNYGVTTGRNVGATATDADLLLFLDDDAVPADDFVERHRRGHDRHDLVAARGRVRPRTNTVYNDLQPWYDLGDEPGPYCLDAEGNTSIDRAAFVAVGGFDESLDGRAGHEGIELTQRLLEAGYGREQIYYLPDPVVYHDYATSLGEYVRKEATKTRSQDQLVSAQPGFTEFARSFTPPGNGTDSSGPIGRAKVSVVDLTATAGVSLLKLWRTIRGGGDST